MSTIPKRLVLFFDGTDNTPKDRTNVWRLHELTADADGTIPQQKKYIQGVGTEFGNYVSGSIFGAGVARKIREGYDWLVENYVEGAEIFVFGFSRGAFTARSLVQMVANVGIVRPGVMSTGDAFDRYEDISRQETEKIRPLWRLRRWMRHPEEKPAGWVPSAQDAILMDEKKVHMAKIKMAGLWDTVGSIGLTGLTNSDARIQKAAAHNVRPTKAQEYGYQAIAIDEHRALFEITLWRTFLKQGEDPKTKEGYAKSYEQCWFIGAHSDVGGGYDDDNDRLPDITLEWMMEKAAGVGLKLTHKVQPQAGAWHGVIHDSFKAFAGGILSIWDKVKDGNQRHYRGIEKAPRQVTTSKGEAGELWPIHETIHPSVMKRWTEDPTYRPPSLVDFFQRHPEKLPAGTTLSQRTKRIYASRYWNETGVFLKAGAKYRATLVTGAGEPLKDASQTAKGIEGEDWNSLAYKVASKIHGKRKDDAKWFALIGTVDKKDDWALTDGGIFKAENSGQLVCYFNDVQLEWFYGNNSGWVLLDVQEAP
jgi:uncharacterized protein (DUF2235 family)